jgi:hypothetical protein
MTGKRQEHKKAILDRVAECCKDNRDRSNQEASRRDFTPSHIGISSFGRCLPMAFLESQRIPIMQLRR